MNLERLSPASKIGRFSVLLRRNTQLLGSASITRREERTIESLNSYPPKGESSISNPTIYLPTNLLLRNSTLLRKLFQLLDAQPIPLSDDSVTFDTLHLVARNLGFRLSLVQLD